MSDEEQEDLERFILIDKNDSEGKTSSWRPRKLAHGKRSMSDEAFRAPVVLAYKLREEIMGQRAGNSVNRKLVWRHPCNEEFYISDEVTVFMKGELVISTLIL